MIGNTILDLDAKAVSAVQYVPPVSPAAPDYFRQNLYHRRRGRAEAPGFSRYPLQVMGKQILVETPLIGRHNLGMLRWPLLRRKN